MVLDKSLTHGRVADFTVRNVLLQAGSQERPLIRPDVPVWTLTGAGAAELTLDGIFLGGGCDLVLAGSFERVTLSCCTLDPGSWGASDWRSAADGRPLAATRLRIEGVVRELVIDRSITGPILTAGPRAASDRSPSTRASSRPSSPAPGSSPSETAT